MISNFANINIDKVFDALGIQLYAHRPSVPILEATRSSDYISSNVAEDGLHISISGMTREYSGKYYCTTLKSAAIKLYILLYFYTHSNGLTDEIGYNEISDLLGVHKKTVRAALKRLDQEEYIEFYPEKHTFFCRILNYKDMYEHKKIHHVGYITLNRELLNGILNVSGINSLRCSILSIFKLLRNQFKSATKLAAAEIRMNEFTFNMPKYVKPYIIEQSINEAKTFFSSCKKVYDKFIITLDHKYQASVIKQQLRKEGKEKINDYIAGINALRESALNDIQKGPGLSLETQMDALKYKINDIQLELSFDGKTIPELDFTSDQKNDLYGLCTEYNVEIILNAIGIYYNKYKLAGLKQSNPGGLIRSIIRELILLNQDAT